MKIALSIVSALCLFFAVTTVMLWRHERQVDAEIYRLQKEAQSKPRPLPEGFTAQKQADHERVRLGVCGIYELSQRNRGAGTKVMDFRSDGTVVSYSYYGYNSDNHGRGKLDNWVLTEDDQVQIGSSFFAIEPPDLIDSQRNRWERVR